MLQLSFGACVVVLVADINECISSVLTVRILSGENFVRLKESIIPALFRILIARLFSGFTEKLRTCRDSIQRFSSTLVGLIHSAHLLVFGNRFLKLLRGVVGFADVILPEGGIVSTRITTHHITEDITSGSEVTDRFFRHLAVHAYLHPSEFKVRSGCIIQCGFRVLTECIRFREESLINVTHERRERTQRTDEVLRKFHANTDRIVNLTGLEQ